MDDENDFVDNNIFVLASIFGNFSWKGSVDLGPDPGTKKTDPMHCFAVTLPFVNIKHSFYKYEENFLIYKGLI